jgi:hypothetical protein
MFDKPPKKSLFLTCGTTKLSLNDSSLNSQNIERLRSLENCDHHVKRTQGRDFKICLACTNLLE